jgi:hypothetical protein
MSSSANPWNGSEEKHHDTKENKPQSQTHSKLTRELGIKHKKPWMSCKLTKQEMFTCGYYFLTLNEKFQPIFTETSLQTPDFLPTSKHILKLHSKFVGVAAQTRNKIPLMNEIYTPNNFPKQHGRIKMVSTKWEGNLPCRGGSVCLSKLWCLQLKESYVQHVAIIARFELSVWLRTNEPVAGKYPGLYNLAGHCWHVCRC